MTDELAMEEYTQMKNTRYNRKRARNIRRAKTMILFITVAIIVVITSGILAEKIFIQNNAIASEAEESENESDKSGNNVADDVAFVEKYLNQQEHGQMPDGADGKKVVYLTFDDGPSETVTPQILDILKEEDVKATFFIVGHALEKSDVAKEILKRESEEGHSIGNHTYSHNYKYLYPNKTVNVDNFMSDIEKTNSAIREVLGEDFSVRAIRFPGGHMTWKGTKALDEVLWAKDYHYVDWNSLSKDSEGKSKNADQLFEQVIETAKGREKAVVLMHDNYGKEETAKALPKIIEYFKEQGYEFRTMK